MIIPYLGGRSPRKRANQMGIGEMGMKQDDQREDVYAAQQAAARRIQLQANDDTKHDSAFAAKHNGCVGFGDLKEVAGLKLSDISCELYREYVIDGTPYRIAEPVGLYIREGGTTHRVVDSLGITHCVPFPAAKTVLRWKNRAGFAPVKF